MNKSTEKALRYGIDSAANDKLKKLIESDSFRDAVTQSLKEGISNGFKPMFRKAIKPWSAIVREAIEISKNPLISEMNESEAETVDFEGFYEETIIAFRDLIEVAKNGAEREINNENRSSISNGNMSRDMDGH